MADPRGALRSALRRYRPGILLLLGWVATLGLHWRWTVSNWLQDAIYRVFSGFPALVVSVDKLREVLLANIADSYPATLFIASLAVPLAVVLRMVARARLRAGHVDPLDRVRRFIAAHPRWTAAATAGPGALMQLAWIKVAVPPYAGYHFHQLTFWAVAALTGALQWKLAAAGLRAFLVPTVEHAVEQGSIDADEIHFSAVAVTRETLGMVGGLGALTLAASAWMATMDIQRLYRDPRLFTAMMAYIAIAAVSALAFRQASRIGVGVDGVRVSGTSRTRFFAYRDMDEVREERGDVLLVRRGRTLLRLQLHGPDAVRRDAIVDRVRAGIARVAEVERDGAANLVKATSPETVARSMRGGADYRMASVSRDGLWALVEGAAVDGDARTAAARAILETGTDEERSRVRVAAGHCADPQVRITLEQMADEEPEPPRVAVMSRE
ncbi:MAG TPA: hypothetical protein VF765_13230 [Polyangiaceae bacterium]